MSNDKDKKAKGDVGKQKRMFPLLKTNLQRSIAKAENYKQISFSENVSIHEMFQSKNEATQLLTSLQRNLTNLQELVTDLSLTIDEADNEPSISDDQLMEAETLISDGEELFAAIQTYVTNLTEFQATLHSAQLKEKQLQLDHEATLERLRLQSSASSVRSRQSSLRSLAIEDHETAVKEIDSEVQPQNPESNWPISKLPQDKKMDCSQSHEDSVKQLQEAVSQLTKIVSENVQAPLSLPAQRIAPNPSPDTDPGHRSFQQFTTPVNMPAISPQFHPTLSSGGSQPSIRLPKLQLQPFDGTLTKWTTFWGLFKSSIHDSNLMPIEKLNYLLGYLKGEAKATVEGLPITNENYEVAVTLLMERFGNKNAIVNSLFTQLETLRLQGISARQIRHFVNELEAILRQLEAGGEPTESQHLTSHLLKKLPSNLRLKLHAKLPEPVKWNVQTIRKALKGHVEALEEVEEDERSEKQSHWKPMKQWTPSYQDQRFLKPMKPTGEALATSTRTVNEPKTLIIQRQKPTSQCIFCKEFGHYYDDCPKHTKIDQRKKVLSNESRCFNCLQHGHGSKNCQKKKTCFHCKRQGHNSSLCFEREKQMSKHHSNLMPTKPDSRKQDLATANSVIGQEAQEITVQNESSSNLLNTSEAVVMQTAQAEIENPTNHKKQLVKILFDSGSQRSYIQTKVAKSLQLKPIATQSLTINTFGDATGRTFHLPLVEFAMWLKDGTAMTIQANEKPLITGKIHKAAIPKEMIRFPTHLLADKPSTKPEEFEIQLLIGLDYMQDIVGTIRQQISPGFYATESKLGLILAGRVVKSSEGTDSNILAVHINREKVSTVNSLQVVDSKLFLEDIGSLERIGIYDETKTTEDELAMKNFKDTVQFHEGRYAVTWPWKPDLKPDSGKSNFGLAMGRLKSTLNRLAKNSDTLEKYNSIIQDQHEKGIIELAYPADFSSHYLPHHPVITPLKSTTKVRIVYDASAKPTKGKLSLNDCMYRGPVLLQDLIGLLLRFRVHPIVLISDIEKAFLQVKLQPSERNVCRFLWIKDPTNLSTSLDNIQHFQFRRVPFGVISSPFLLGATVQHHLKQIGTKNSLDILDNIYVDNVITGANDMNSATQFYKEAKNIFADASMNLREWSSNSQEFLESIPEKDRAKTSDQKVLGVKWDTYTDSLSFPMPRQDSQSEKVTKRFVLHTIASLFDPLGLVSFATFKAKVFLQRLWLEELDWDQELSQELKQEWIEIKQSLAKLDKITIPRFVGSNEENLESSLICFTDASEKGYAALVYLKFKSQVKLIFTKTRVAPKTSKKLLSIPRLELMGVWVGAKILQFVEHQLKRTFKQKVLWTDSQCVLYWLKSKELGQVFVANRIRDIQKVSAGQVEFRYVSTKENPADIATRGIEVNAVKDSLWWHGPKWLVKDENEWPSGDLPHSTEATQAAAMLELKAIKPAKALDARDDLQIEEYKCFIKRFSSLHKLIRVVVWCLRVKNKNRGAITMEELNMARGRVTKWSQEINFNETLKAIIKGKMDESYKNFGLKVHVEDGLLHCHGRLQNADLSSSAVYPVLLAKNDPYTDLVIKTVHRSLFHAGTEHTLAHLRYRYWIPQGRRQVHKVLHQCQVCRKHEGGPYHAPKMAPWPQKRVVKSTPFTYTGLDYCGPLFVKKGKEIQKTWVCLFTCLASRAIHLDVVEDMSTKAFLECLTRFISLRGCPVEITCDNAPIFKTAKDIFEKMWKKTIYDPTTINYCSEKGIKWNYIVELAPWMGGVYERLIGVVKKSLRKAVGKKSLSFIELQTLLYQISAIINSRPLTYVGDFESGQPLTPADLLNPGSRLGIPAFEMSSSCDPDYQPKTTFKDELWKNWQERLELLEEFWKQWESEYILNLRERSQTSIKQTRIRAKENPKINDVVLIKENQIPRGRWKMGKIIELTCSKDSEIRSAKVVLPNKKVLHRSVTHLYPLETSKNERKNECDTDFSEKAAKETVNYERTTKRAKNQRKAAIRADQLIQNYYDKDGEEIELDD